MKKVKVSFDTWIQLLGMIGVLGGLVFVGLEMQQSQRIAIAGQLQARNDAIMNYWSAPLDGSAIWDTKIGQKPQTDLNAMHLEAIRSLAKD